MPELPEVETTVHFLKNNILGQKIKNVKVYWPKLLEKGQDLLLFKNNLINQKIHDVQRRAKYILFFFANIILISHLRMEGQYYITDDLQNFDNHTLLIFTLSFNKYLCYRDTRRFGTFDLRNYDNYLNTRPLVNLGLEPFDANLNAKYLQEKWTKKRLNIKAALLEQKYIVGIGNIYASEILYHAKINPFLPANKLKLQQIEDIIFWTRIILEKAIASQGSKISSFLVNKEIKSRYQNKLNVYQKEGQICKICFSKIKKVKLNQRSCYYCETCQK